MDPLSCDKPLVKPEFSSPSLPDHTTAHHSLFFRFLHRCYSSLFLNAHWLHMIMTCTVISICLHTVGIANALMPNSPRSSFLYHSCTLHKHQTSPFYLHISPSGISGKWRPVEGAEFIYLQIYNLALNFSTFPYHMGCLQQKFYELTLNYKNTYFAKRFASPASLLGISFPCILQ